MKKIFLVGISTLLRFAGQFLFIKSLSHLSEKSILTTLNLQSLSVLLAGFSSGGVQTYLSKYIPLSSVKTAWNLGLNKSSRYYFYSLVSILPAYLIINNNHESYLMIMSTVGLSLLLSYSNNWQGLLTGQKKYLNLIFVFLTQFSIFLLIYLLGNSLDEWLFLFLYPTAVIISSTLSYLFDKKLLSDHDTPVDEIAVAKDISSHRAMGIVLMTAGVAYPFIVRNLLLKSFPLSEVVNWDYILRISTAYTSISSFFLFTLFASDTNRDEKNQRRLFLTSFVTLVPYLLIFTIFNDFIFKILLSRDFQVEVSALKAFIFFEASKALFTTICMSRIISGKNNQYIIVEIFNIVFAAFGIYLFAPKTMTMSFMILSGCFLLSLLTEKAMKHKQRKEINKRTESPQQQEQD